MDGKKKKIKEESFDLLSSILFYLILYVIFSAGFYPERFSVEVSGGEASEERTIATH